MPSHVLSRLAIAATILLTSACATQETLHRDWSEFDGPGAEHFQREEIVPWDVYDPAEPVNRVADDVKHAAVEYVVAPIAWAWRLITTAGVRQGIGNLGTNLAYPVRLVSNVAQGNWERAGTETERFAINTTIGVLGWSDAARERGVPAPRPQDIGLALRHHGWKRSAYMSLPRPTVRDTVGLVPDRLLDPATHVPGASALLALNELSGFVDAYVRFTKTTYDPYRLERTARYLDRTLEETDREFAGGDGGAVDTLQYVFLGVTDRGFIDASETGSALLPATGRRLRYDVWLQDEPSPVVYVLPGTGGHRSAESTAAIAELVHRAGYHAVSVSSALCYEFIENAATVDFPGFAPADAHDVHGALTAIDADLRREHGALVMRRRGLVGMSLGGIHALFIAASEDRAAREGLVPFDAYYAINPPVSLMQAAKGFDDYFNLPLEMFPDPETRRERVQALFRHVIDVAGGGDLRPGRPLPLDERQAQFLIGVAFRMTLMDVLDQARALGRTGDFFRTPRTDRDRGASYRELARYSFMEYLFAFVLPEQARRHHDITNDEQGARRLAWRSDLRSAQLELSRNPRVRVFTNSNEILLRPADIAFLERTFGGRLQLNDGGGHLGNLWRQRVRDRVTAVLRTLIHRD